MQQSTPSFFPDDMPSPSSPDEASSRGLLASVIPTFVRRRLPALRTVSSLANTLVQTSPHHRSISLASNISAPPPYSTASSSDDDDADADMDAEFASAPSSRPTSSDFTSELPVSTTFAQQQAPAQAFSQDALIRAKFTNHGLVLIAQSAHESRSNPHRDDEYTRRLYLDGVVYLLRGMPDGLSDDEKASLRIALPETIRDTPPTSISASRRKSSNTLIHDVVAALVFGLFLAAATALPYAKFIVRHACAFERKHKLGELCVQHGVTLAQVLYAQAAALACAVWAINDRVLARTLADAGLWCAQNVGEGVRDGLADAVATLRAMQGEKQGEMPGQRR